MSAVVCWNCGQSLDEVPRPISRHSQCSNCFNDLHCCRLCRYFDPGNTTSCLEDRADPPLEKENANFCEFFAPQAGAFTVQTTHNSDGARSELDALFGSPDERRHDNTSNDGASAAPPSSPVDGSRKKLEDLFKP